jgi:hypothetical protein
VNQLYSVEERMQKEPVDANYTAGRAQLDLFWTILSFLPHFRAEASNDARIAAVIHEAAAAMLRI